MTLRQGRRSVMDYAIQFRTVAATSGWNDEALTVCFHKGLSEVIQDKLATRVPSDDLESLIKLASRIHQRLIERELNQRSRTITPISPIPESLALSPLAPPEPIQTGRISQAERDRRMREHCCLYCSKPGHFCSSCPGIRGNAPSLTCLGDLKRETSPPQPSSSRLLIPVPLS